MGEGFALQAQADQGDVVADIERSCHWCGKPVSKCRNDLTRNTRLGMFSPEPVAPVVARKRPEVTLEQVKACVTNTQVAD